MITVERLPKQEFGSLRKIEEGFVPNADESIVVVAKDGEKIVGRMFLISVAHVEGTWIDAEARNGTIAARMMREMEKQAAGAGLRTIFAYAEDEKVGEYIERLGYSKVPLAVFRKELPCH